MKRLICILLFFAGPVVAQKHLKLIESGKKLIAEEKYDLALRDLTKAIEAKPNEAEAYYQRGRCYLFLDKNTEAKNDLLKATELDGKRSAYYNLLGAACENLKDSAGALVNYNRAVALDSSDCKALNNLAGWYTAKQQYRQALGYSVVSIKKCPGDPLNYLAKGAALEGLKDTAGAVAAYEAALRVDTGFYAAWFSLAYLYNSKAAYKQALGCIGRAIAGDPANTEYYVERGKSQEGTGDTLGAIASYGKAIELDPKNSLAYFSRGSLYSARDKQLAAIADFTKMTQIDGADADAFYARAQCYADTENYQAAIADLEQAKKLNPADPYIYFQLGNCQDATRYYREAIDSYSQAIKLDSTNAEFYYGKGSAHHNLEEMDQARLNYAKALKLDSTTYSAYFNIGNIYFDGKNYTEAIKYYDSYLARVPADSDALTNRGICRKALLSDKEACDDWKKAAALGSAEASENLKKFCR